jgi:hypothetical protein
MYAYGNITLAETVPGTGENGRMEKDGGGEFTYYILDIL